MDGYSPSKSPKKNSASRILGILSAMASRFTERRLVDVDAADEDEVELDDELDESGGDVLVEGV